MYTNIFDTHAHYVHRQFQSDRTELLAQLPADGIRYIMLAGCSISDSEQCIALAEQYDTIYCSVGIHPENMPSEDGWQSALEALAKHDKVRAIGEIGLDYHTKGYDRELQKTVFLQQLELAEKLQLPVIIHIREAMGDALEILRQYHPKGVVHCFSGSAETARELTDLGLYLGIGGVLTYANARKVVEAVRIIPEDKLLLETDCPYLTPEPFRRERNDSRKIAVVAERAAELRNTNAQELINICCENGKQLFGI